MRASFADLTLLEVKLSVPREKVAASELEEDDEEVAGRSGRVGDGGIVAALGLWGGL